MSGEIARARRRSPATDSDPDGHIPERPPGEPDPYYGRRHLSHPHARGCRTCTLRILAAHRGLSVAEFLDRYRAVDPDAA